MAKKHASIVRMVIVLAVFIVGYASFSLFALRFGWRPADWATAGAARALTSAVSSCYTGNDGDRTKFIVCAQKKMVPSIHLFGVRAFMNALDARQAAQTDATRAITQCHDLAHAIGWGGILVTKNLNAVLPECTDTCVYGCQHGAVSAWYATGNDIVKQLPTLCVSGVDWSTSPQGQGGCFHELGHAVANLAGYNIVSALKYCDQVDSRGRLDCGYGVFMELFEPATFADKPQPLPANHPAWCEELWPPYKEFCYDQAGVNDYGRNMNDAHAFAACARTPQQYQMGCFRNLGTNIFYVYQHEPDQIAAIEAFCHREGDPWFMPCVSGVLLSSVMSETSVEGGIKLCARLSNSDRSACFTILGSILDHRRTKAQKATICQTVPSQDRSTCVNGHTDPYE